MVPPPAFVFFLLETNDGLQIRNWNEWNEVFLLNKGAKL